MLEKLIEGNTACKDIWMSTSHYQDTIIFIVFISSFVSLNYFSNILPINNIIPTSLFHILVVTLAIFYLRNYYLA